MLSAYPKHVYGQQKVEIVEVDKTDPYGTVKKNIVETDNFKDFS